LLFGLIGEDYELAAKVLDATVPEIKRWIASLGPMEVLQKAGFLIRERDVDKVFLIQDVLPSYLLELTFKEVQAMDMPKVRKVVKGIEVEWKAGKKGIDVTAIADKVKENVPVSGISMTVIKQLGHFNTKSEYVVSLIEKDCIARGIYAKKSE
jgi:6-phosphogluconate dehydrogenase